MNKKNLNIWFWLFLFQTVSFASGGSLYTRYGVGDVFHYFTARNMSLGGGGYSLLATPDNFSPINPASWSSIKFTQFNIGIIYDGMKLSNNTENVFYSTTKFSGFNLGFPLDKDLGLSMVMGLMPVSNVEYEVDNVLANQIVGSPKFSYVGDGSINKVYLGFSYKLPYDFRIGGTFEYYTGDITYSSTMTFDNTSTFSNATFKKELSYRGIGSTVGLISGDISKLFDNSIISNWRLGLTFVISPNLNTDSTETSITKIGSNTTQSALVSTNLPVKIGIGTSFILNKNYLILVDYIFQPWSKFTFNNVADNNLRNLTRFSLGFEYKNSGASRTGFWEQIKFRGGLSYEQTQYRILGEDINEYGIYGGFSIPIGPLSNLDVGISYGVRGTKNLNLIQENFIKTSVSISFGELWFIRRER